MAANIEAEAPHSTFDVCPLPPEKEAEKKERKAICEVP
jgi:hypothetical protein